MISKTVRFGIIALGFAGLAACQSVGVSVGAGTGGVGVGVHGNAANRFAGNEQLVTVDTRELRQVGNPRLPDFAQQQ